jgi:3-dehydroquinate dehydratase/shikimate dehydrogenase
MIETNKAPEQRQQNGQADFTLLQRRATSPVFNGLEGFFRGMQPFGKGVGRICAVVAGSRASEFRALVGEALRKTPTVELRLDWLRSDAERHRVLDWLKRSERRGAVFIATCRRRVAGGELAGDAGTELYWLMKAKEAGCEWCDLEVETLRELPGGSVEDYALPRKVLLSIHDFRRTPKLPDRVKIPARGGVAAVKVAAMARKISDGVRLLRLAHREQQVVTVPMGEIGLPARILALREGSALAYAPVAAATAPGQVHLGDLKELYRAHELNKATRVYGVIGNPIGHSMSPLLHNTGYVAARKNAVFLPFLVEKLGDFLKAVPEFDLSGFSVTLPHKQAMFRYLDDCEPLAEKIGAVNTVTVRRNGKLYGSNTDYVGVLKALERRMRLKGSRVLVFGAGGAARAAAFALRKAGAEVCVCARRPEAAEELARAAEGEVIRRAELRKQKFDAIVNSTPLGMYPHPQISPLGPRELNCSLVMDLIYRPFETKLLKIARARGIRTVPGVELFLAQGITQWEHWMGWRAPEAAMRRAVLGALRAEEKSRR